MRGEFRSDAERIRRRAEKTRKCECPRGTKAGRACPKLRRPMQPGSNPRYRRVVSHLKYAARGLSPVAGTPPRDKGTREGRIEEIDRDGVIEHAAHPRWGDRPAISATILIEPGGHLRMPLA